MNDVLPSWLEITTDDYYSRSLRRDPGSQSLDTARKRLDRLLAQQHVGAFRLRIVLREDQDLKPGLDRNPLSIKDYEYGPDLILDATEIVVITREGQRHRVGG